MCEWGGAQGCARVASLAASEKCDFHSPLARLRRRGTLRCAVLLRASPGCPSMEHPLGGAKHASLKDTAEPLYPGGNQTAQPSSDHSHSRLTTHFRVRGIGLLPRPWLLRAKKRGFCAAHGRANQTERRDAREVRLAARRPWRRGTLRYAILLRASPGHPSMDTRSAERSMLR
jgi:hypothetical protein